MFKEIEEINTRPKPFEFYTAAVLWTDPHTSKQMLEYHLNESLDLASRNPEFIDRSAGWIASQTSGADRVCIRPGSHNSAPMSLASTFLNDRYDTHRKRLREKACASTTCVRTTWNLKQTSGSTSSR